MIHEDKLCSNLCLRKVERHSMKFIYSIQRTIQRIFAVLVYMPLTEPQLHGLITALCRT